MICDNLICVKRPIPQNTKHGNMRSLVLNIDYVQIILSNTETGKSIQS